MECDFKTELEKELCRRIGHLPIQPGKTDVSGQVKAPIYLKGQADPGLHSCVFEDLYGIPNRLKILITVRIGC